VTDASLVSQTVAAALGVAETPGRSRAAALGDFLRSKQLLLVLDNCEHLVDACAVISSGLLRVSAGLCILATSRAFLGTDGETIWSLPNLGHSPTCTRQRAGSAGVSRLVR
jgi:predicted ATPase